MFITWKGFRYLRFDQANRLQIANRGTITTFFFVANFDWLIMNLLTFRKTEARNQLAKFLITHMDTSLSNLLKFYIGDSLKQCDADNQNALNTCLFQIVEDLRPFMPTGKLLLLLSFNYPLPQFSSPFTLALNIIWKSPSFVCDGNCWAYGLLSIESREEWYCVLHGKRILGMKVKVGFLLIA